MICTLCGSRSRSNPALRTAAANRGSGLMCRCYQRTSLQPAQIVDNMYRQAVFRFLRNRIQRIHAAGKRPCPAVTDAAADEQFPCAVCPNRKMRIVGKQPLLAPKQFHTVAVAALTAARAAEFAAIEAVRQRRHKTQRTVGIAQYIIHTSIPIVARALSDVSASLPALYS